MSSFGTAIALDASRFRQWGTGKHPPSIETVYGFARAPLPADCDACIGIWLLTGHADPEALKLIAEGR